MRSTDSNSLIKFLILDFPMIYFQNLGMRFAMIEMKLLIAKILSKYEFKKCDHTKNFEDRVQREGKNTNQWLFKLDVYNQSRTCI